MTRKRSKARVLTSHHLAREESHDRIHLSINDWYGEGVLRGLGIEAEVQSMTEAPRYGGSACVDQYAQGVRDGRRLNALANRELFNHGAST